jgi:hypothetical protein
MELFKNVRGSACKIHALWNLLLARKPLTRHVTIITKQARSLNEESLYRVESHNEAQRKILTITQYDIINE